MSTEKTNLKCQFCGYVGKGWLNEGMTCPKCGKDYDWSLAQDSEEQILQYIAKCKERNE